MSLLFTCILAALLLACWFVYNYRRIYNELYVLCHIPGPKQHWAFGNLELKRAHSPHRVMFKWMKEFGPIFRVRILGRTVVVVTEPSIVHRAYRPGREQFHKNLRFYQQHLQFLTKPALPNIISSPTNAYWRAVRRAIAPAFAMVNLRNVFPEVRDHTKKVSDVLKQCGPKTSVDIDMLAQRLTIDVLGQFGFNQDFGATNLGECEMLRIIKRALAAVQKRTNPVNQWCFWRQEYKEFWAACNDYDAIVSQIVDAMLKSPPAPHTLAAHLLKVVNPATGLPLTRDQLKTEVGVLLTAGFETTAHSISWTLFQLAVNPEADRRVAAELSSLGLLSEAGGAEPRDPCWDDLSKIPYLNAVINESMRMMPVVAQGSPRIVGEDMEVLGYKVPPGTVMAMPFHAIHNSPLNWPHADLFMPERWLDNYAMADQDLRHHNSEGVMCFINAVQKCDDSFTKRAAYADYVSAPERKTQACRMPSILESKPSEQVHADPAVSTAAKSAKARGFFPFSMGARDCVGQSLAMLELRVTLMMLLGRFRFQLTPESGGKQAVLDSAKMLVTMKPENGLWVRCIPRDMELEP